MKIKNRINELSRKALDLFFPDRCPFCGCLTVSGETICEECSTEYQPCYEKRIISGITCYTACLYGDMSGRVVLGAKNNRDGTKLDFMAYEIYNCLEYYNVIPEIDCITAVPMYISDKIKRGYNQSEKICRTLSILTEIPYINAVTKIRHTDKQKTLGRQKRLDNLSNTFSVSNPFAIEGKTVLLIDDVTTTGATLTAVCKELVKAGSKNVILAAFAYTPPDRNNHDE